MKKIIYSGVILDEESRRKLIHLINIPLHFTIYADHCTICLGPLPENKQNDIGKKIILKGSFIYRDNSSIVFKVDNLKRLDNIQAHITIAINEQKGITPKDSKNINEWNINLKKSIQLTGILTEVTGNQI